jgi:Lamin Tail Domain
LIANDGDEELDLGGWRLHDDSSRKAYVFPTGTVLGVGASVRVRSGREAATPGRGELAWTTASVWNDRGDTAFLEDPGGMIVSSRKG